MEELLPNTTLSHYRFSISRDDRVIYNHFTQTESDVWLMTLE
ncbi:MAG TPA: hypothetical protein VGL29_14005 [Blastocatellia bacterium]